MEKIGIFPLNLVIFPESVFPLHIFEERYKKLILDCVKENKPFGIVLTNRSKLHEVGCLVEISDVFKKYDDGQMDILVAGIKRFRVSNIIDGEKPYLIANVDYFDDKEEFHNSTYLREAIELYNKVVTSITFIKIEQMDNKKIEAKYPSYFIAQKAGLTVEQKQEILENKSENSRLKYLIEHLQSVLPLAGEAETITKIMKYDGYYKPKFFKH